MDRCSMSWQGRLRRWLLALLAVACLDQASKYIIEDRYVQSHSDEDLRTYGGLRTRLIDLGDGKVRFGLAYVRNFGAAWDGKASLDPSHSSVRYIVISIAFLAGIALVLARFPERLPGSSDIWLAALAGGVLSNLIDRALRGYVVDYLDFGVNIGSLRWHAPNANFADLVIVIAILAILFQCIRADFGSSSQKS